MSIMLGVMFFSMFIYVNTLYYSMVLLIIVLSLLYILVSNLMVHSLTMLMLSIVYIGAMMILIGYICAICPNLILTPVSIPSSLYLLVIILTLVTFPLKVVAPSSLIFIPMANYFYTYSGMLIFFTLIFMLFVTLLMVTSQYMTPKGPFRSVTI